MRIGQGYDAHRFIADTPLVLGGAQIDYPLGMEAHSDGDVLLHALCDALLGAVALGDIGKHFPDNDPQYKGADSRNLLRAVLSLTMEAGYQVVNADMTIVAQKPKLAPYIDTMGKNISKDLRVERAAVNVKATTTEGMGFAGRGEGIACYAVVLLEKTK